MTLEERIDLYCTAWCETDAALRWRILDQVLVADVTYCDPNVQVTNRGALSDYISGVLAARPGSRVRRTSAVDVHHGVARFAWHLIKADGTTLPEGLDIVVIDEATGKLKSVLGFFGPLQSGA